MERTEEGPEPFSWPQLKEWLAGRIGALGLRLRGGFVLDANIDSEIMRLFPDAAGILLVGNVGGELWKRSGRAILAEGGENPLNTWIRRSLAPIAEEAGAGIVFDFEGPPFFPFQRWAQRAETVFPSPLGILIHPEHGLWHAYRAALVFDGRFVPPDRGHALSPCAACRDKPCLSVCPVGAFDGSTYDVARCRDHVLGIGEQCREAGCLARLACPIGASSRYARDQMTFHMQAFVASLRRRDAMR